MIRSIAVPVESARYTPPVLFVPGLWADAGVWGGVPSALAHRGWDGALVEFPAEGVPGGMAERAESLAAHVRGLRHPPVLVGHDAGAVLAVDVARRVPLAAMVLLAPLRPGAWDLRLLVRRWDAFAALLRGRRVPPPHPDLLTRVLGRAPADLARCSEPGAVVLDVVRGRVGLEPAPDGPVLLVGGALDPHLPPQDAQAMARRLGAEHRVVAESGHWLPLEPSFTATVATIHRWLVQTLGADVLELHAEAMADRGDEPD